MLFDRDDLHDAFGSLAGIIEIHLATHRGTLELIHICAKRRCFGVFDIFSDAIFFDAELVEERLKTFAGFSDRSFEANGMAGEIGRVDVFSVFIVGAFAAAHLGNAKIKTFVGLSDLRICATNHNTNDNDSDKHDGSGNEELNHEGAEKRFAVSGPFTLDGNLVEISLVIHELIISQAR